MSKTPTDKAGQPIKPLRDSISEEAFQQSVIQMADLHGWICYHQRPAMNRSGKWATALTGTKGFPDLVIAKEGRKGCLFREMKSMTGRLAPEQKLWGRILLSAGEDWAVWRPSDWASIESVLTQS